VRELLHPASIAVIGASDDEEKWGGRVMLHLQKFGFGGRLLPVNGRRREVLGLPAHPRIGEAPGPVDVAAIVVPAETAVASAEECAAAGAGACVVVSAGFAEAGPEGRAREQALARIAQQSGMRVLGPNCLGFVNPRAGVALSPSLSLAAMTHLPAGGLGLASQSGALMGSLLIRGFDAGAGFSACVSVGNQADLELCDIFEYLIDDPATRVVCLYIEALRDTARFAALAERARAEGKPVLAARAGRTPEGAAAVRAHTGRRPEPYGAFRDACREHGVVLVDDALDLLPAAETLIRRGGMPAAGIAIFSGSGGAAALWTDAIRERGLRPAALGPATRAALGRYLPAERCALPVDLGAVRRPPGASRDAVEHIAAIVMDDPDVGAGVYVLTTQPDSEAAAGAAAAAAARCGKPLLFVHAAGSSGEGARRLLREARMFVFESGPEALRALAALAAERAARAASGGAGPNTLVGRSSPSPGVPAGGGCRAGRAGRGPSGA
jgi:acyl-CoA synthetase (NDP forming)